MSQDTPLPTLLPRTVRAMAFDPYIGEPAMDNPAWAGCIDADARSFIHEDWGYCVHPSGGIFAMNSDGDGAMCPDCSSSSIGDWGPM